MCAKNLNKEILRYAMRKGVTVVAAKTYRRWRFSMCLRRKAAISILKRIHDPGCRTFAHLNN